MSEPEPAPGTSGDDFRPWELPGNVRRDCAPHRGELLLLLGRIAEVFSIFFLCGIQNAMIGLVLGTTVWFWVRHDLRLIQKGLMDPAGQPLLERARRRSVWAIRCALLYLIILAALWLTLLVIHLLQ
jgi:hypothetical protein